MMQSDAGYFPKRSSPCLCLNIRRASRAVSAFYEKMLEPSGLKIAQYSLLRHLEQTEPVTITRLAHIMRIDRTTLNRNMKPLLSAGLIAVRAGEDPRSRQVELTAAGKSALGSALALWDQAQASLQEYLGETETAQFNRLVAKLEALVP
ncbi:MULTISPECIES: MarR family winged helix-turn-helix transcriptional regulator [Sporomusa]|uniref:MarR family protein n=1 Tax=Sporomusa sphaeroides DSM 2875 TaxID=1337886 RepID=A0ABM9W2W5_9FIRM|nr:MULTISPECIES: MarR family winged helix-turn-helix transcriptional regulator [Sporomusa]OLS54998.1 MarR family protein [Sporomusa sphaeroides DSM 2875]CVK19444.1 MarR family protein [Sporomusa sphaeroides DSM 2875]